MKPKRSCAECGHIKHHEFHAGSTWTHDFVKPDEWSGRKRAQEPRPCELAGHSPCGRGDLGELTWHHAQPRGSGGTSHDDSPLVRLCVKHHRFVEENREWAREHGLLIRRKP